MKIGQQIKFYREQKGYSQKELAALVHMSERTVGHYETGTRSPSVESLHLLSNALGIDITSFFISHESLHDAFEIPSDTLVCEKTGTEEIRYPKKHMDAEEFKRIMKNIYEEEEFVFVEDEQYIQVYNITNDRYAETYDKAFANHLISLADKDTVLHHMFFEKDRYFKVSGSFHGEYFYITANRCEEHGYDFSIYTYKNHVQYMPPLVFEAWDWFLETFQPQHIHKNFFSHAYFSDFSPLHISSYRIARCDGVLLGVRAYNCLENRNLLTLENILSLTNEEVRSFNELGHKSGNEILYFQEDMQEWIETYAKK